MWWTINLFTNAEWVVILSTRLPIPLINILLLKIETTSWDCLLKNLHNHVLTLSLTESIQFLTKANKPKMECTTFKKVIKFTKSIVIKLPITEDGICFMLMDTTNSNTTLWMQAKKYQYALNVGIPHTSWIRTITC